MFKVRQKSKVSHCQQLTSNLVTVRSHYRLRRGDISSLHPVELPKGHLVQTRANHSRSTQMGGAKVAGAQVGRAQVAGT